MTPPLQSPFVTPGEFLNPPLGPIPAPPASGNQGATGGNGTNGAPGANGGNSYALLAFPFVIPAVGATIAITLTNLPGAGGNPTDWLSPGTVISVGGYGFTVSVVTSTTIVSVIPYANALVGTVVFAGVTVAPTGIARDFVSVVPIVTANGDVTSYSLNSGIDLYLLTKTSAATIAPDFILPAASSMTGQPIRIKNVGSYGNITIGAPDKLNANPVGTVSITNNAAIVTFWSDGSGWWN